MDQDGCDDRPYHEKENVGDCVKKFDGHSTYSQLEKPVASCTNSRPVRALLRVAHTCSGDRSAVSARIGCFSETREWEPL